MQEVAHYCQKCLAANPLGQEFCDRCGTRLMIIVEPVSARFETSNSRVLSEEHLLERISALETRQSRLADKLERALDLLLRQAQNSHFDRSLVKALIGLLTDDGVIKNDQLERLWIERCQKDAEEELQNERREELRLRILASYQGGDRDAFEAHVNEGFLFIDDNQISRGIRSLQRAAELPAPNGALLYFVGEYFFKKGRTAKAREYLSRAHAISAGDQRVSLLLGLTCADEGETEQAKELLSSATRLGGPSFAAHYGLGRLFVAEEQWRKALHEFKLALASKASPEAHYVVGCLYYQLNRDSLAARHLRKALEMDETYGEASYVLGLISERAGRSDRAAEYFAKAGLGTSGKTSKNKTQGTRESSVAPPFKVSPAGSRKIVTGGDRRLAEALRQDALNAFDGAELGRR
jgi:tetratricopeptide (TPR) repeat protein